MILPFHGNSAKILKEISWNKILFEKFSLSEKCKSGTEFSEGFFDWKNANKNA